MAGGGSPGSATELAKLTVGAAEYVYSKSQPTRWAVYLSEVERYDEAITFCRTAVASADPAERPGLLNTWATTILSTGGSMREALALHRGRAGNRRHRGPAARPGSCRPGAQDYEGRSARSDHRGADPVRARPVGGRGRRCGQSRDRDGSIRQGLCQSRRVRQQSRLSLLDSAR